MRTKSPYLDSQMAEFYAKSSAKHYFEPPAEDLVKWLQVTKGERILDIGSGSGAVASAASRAVGSSGMVVALDLSIEMLKLQQSNRHRLVACVPGLPFVDDAFDVISAGFVLSHIPDYETALWQINRVLQPMGRFGVTAWVKGTPPVADVWKRVMERFVNLRVVQEEFARIIPWDELFSESIHIEEMLKRAGFVDVKTGTKQYPVSIAPQEYVDTKIGGIEGVILRDSIKDDDWKEFLNQLLRDLQEQFPDAIQYTSNVNFVSGRKPSKD
jgi:ubiquinone/menaquinone biosynthesis C-methylase UbiE